MGDDDNGEIPVPQFPEIQAASNGWAASNPENSGMSDAQLEVLATKLQQWLVNDMSLFYKLTLARYFFEKWKKSNTPFTQEADTMATLYLTIANRYGFRQQALRNNCSQYEQAYYPEWDPYLDQAKIGWVVWVIIAVAVVVCTYILATQNSKQNIERYHTESGSDNQLMDKVLGFVEKHPQLAGQALPLAKSLVTQVQTPESQSTFGDLITLAKWGLVAYVGFEGIQYFKSQKKK